ncbi:MAG: DUF3226 domain-containing protein [Elainellaceae cyanobacterium]
MEGRDDEQVIYQFCNYHRIDNESLFSIDAKNSVDQLLDNLKVRPKQTGIKVLAAVIDADTDLISRWAQICGAVERFGYALPGKPAKDGTILEPPAANRPRLGLWLMPDNQLSGMLEDFLLQLTDSEDSLITRAEYVVDQIPEIDRRFGTTKRSKAVIHTWLAWQKDPGTPLGLSITRRYLEPTRNPAPAFKAWLEALFLPVSPP